MPSNQALNMVVRIQHAFCLFVFWKLAKCQFAPYIDKIMLQVYEIL